jgi:hypothetical protein
VAGDGFAGGRSPRDCHYCGGRLASGGKPQKFFVSETEIDSGANG